HTHILFHHPARAEISTLSLHDALPISLQERIGRRNGLLQRYVAAYRRYCWDVRSVRDLKLAPFHVLATEGKVHVDRDHIWHMERSEEHTSELQSLAYLVCRLLLDKKKK